MITVHDWTAITDVTMAAVPWLFLAVVLLGVRDLARGRP